MPDHLMSADSQNDITSKFHNDLFACYSGINLHANAIQIPVSNDRVEDSGRRGRNAA